MVKKIIALSLTLMLSLSYVLGAFADDLTGLPEPSPLAAVETEQNQTVETPETAPTDAPTPEQTPAPTPTTAPAPEQTPAPAPTETPVDGEGTGPSGTPPCPNAEPGPTTAPDEAETPENAAPEEPAEEPEEGSAAEMATPEELSAAEDDSVFEQEAASTPESSTESTAEPRTVQVPSVELSQALIYTTRYLHTDAASANKVLQLIKSNRNCTEEDYQWMHYFIFESKYRAINNGKDLATAFEYPNGYSTGGYISDGKYTKTNINAEGCYAYSSFVGQVVYNAVGERAYAAQVGDTISAEEWKSFVKINLQPGEHIRSNAPGQTDGPSPHSVTFVANDEDGLYYLNFLNNNEKDIWLCYSTWQQFADWHNESSKDQALWVYNANPKENSLITATKDITAGTVTVSKLAAATYSGTAQQPVVTVKDGTTVLVPEQDYTVDYRDNISAGTASVIITGVGDYYGTRTVEFTIKPYNLSQAEVSDLKDLVYDPTAADGMKQSSLTVQVPLPVENVTLREGEDYTLQYSNNTKAGTAKVKISGIKNFTGSVTKSFTIERRSFAEDFELVLLGKDENGKYSYTGKTIKPKFRVLYKGTYPLSSSDYTVKYGKNKSIDEIGSVAVTGKGNYKDTLQVHFGIRPARMASVTAENLDYGKATRIVWNWVYAATKKLTPKITVRDENGKKVSASQYEVHYDNTYITNTTEDPIEKMGVYKVTVVPSKDGAYASDDTILTTTFVVGLNIANKASVFGLSEQKFDPDKTGQTGPDGITPWYVSLSCYNGIYVDSSLLDIQYGNNGGAGKATVTITAKTVPPVSTGYDEGEGKVFYGTVTKTFKIASADIKSSGFTVSQPGPVIYNGAAQKPPVVVSYNGMPLAEGTDYTLSYGSNKNVGNKAKVTVKAKGNYKGTVTKYFSIEKLDLSQATMEVQALKYSASALKSGKPKVIVSYQGAVLPTSTYSIDYGSRAGWKTGVNSTEGFVITAKGKNTTGSLTGQGGSFLIGTLISGLKISGISKKTFDIAAANGEGIRQTIRVKNGKILLTEGTDYTVAYSKNREAGKATVTLTAIPKENPAPGGTCYVGTVSKTFTIARRDLGSAKKTGGVVVSGYKTGVTYENKPVTFDALTVRDKNDLLTEGKDYTVTYKNNKKANTKATLTITGKGNYSGSIKINYTISY